MKIKLLILTTLLPATLFSQQSDTAYYHGPEAGIPPQDAAFIVHSHLSVEEFLAPLPTNDFQVRDTLESNKGIKYTLSHISEPMTFYEWMSMEVVDATRPENAFNTFIVTYHTGKRRNRTADVVYYNRLELPPLFKEWWGVNLGLPKRLVYPHREQ